jgi:hypothetical protein
MFSSTASPCSPLIYNPNNGGGGLHVIACICRHSNREPPIEPPCSVTSTETMRKISMPHR